MTNSLIKDIQDMDGYQLMAMITPYMVKAQRDQAKLSPEEREYKIQRRLAIVAEQRRRAMITQGKCPSCESKLTRGKKNKEMNYQREWKCSSCEDVHYM